MNFHIPIITNSYYNLSKFDFSFIDVTIYDIQSPEFKNYIDSLNPEFKGANFSFFQNIIQNIYGQYDQRYAIVKNDFRNDFNEKNLYHVYLILLIIFPSNLHLEHSVTFEEKKGFIQRSYMTTMEKTDYDESRYLDSDDDFLPELNEFIKLVFERLKSTSYIGLSIENYVTSYSASHMHFKYINLCMSLENLISGSQELSYRLKRSVSILCGRNCDNCNLIFKNLNEIYKLRSKIVHGEKYYMDDIVLKIEYLEHIVSRTIIELLIHNIPTNSALDKIITSIGFGQREKISENWKFYKLNSLTLYKLRLPLE